MVFNSLIMMCLGVNVFEFLLPEVCWASWMCKFMFLINQGVFSHYFFKYSFALLSLSFYYLYVGTLEWIPQVSEAVFIFFPLFLSSILELSSSSLILFSSSSNLLLSPYGEIFISNIVLFNPRISLYSVSIDNLYLVRSCSYFPLVLEAWIPLVLILNICILNIFKIVD